MKKALLIMAVIMVSIPVYADNAANSWFKSKERGIMVAPGMVQITARVDVKLVKGVPVPQVDAKLLKYVTSSGFVYNKNKTRALMIMEVKAENSAAGKALLEKKKALVNTDDRDLLDREYRGFKKRFKKAALK